LRAAPHDKATAGYGNCADALGAQINAQPTAPFFLVMGCDNNLRYGRCFQVPSQIRLPEIIMRNSTDRRMNHGWPMRMYSFHHESRPAIICNHFMPSNL
ncbi:MAG: hypothetical protein WAM13_13620, partial [Candidatus Sulfotelmatobacter sp.]